MSFPEAVEKLANQAGVPMPARDEREEEREAARRSLYDVMELATQLFRGGAEHTISGRGRAAISTSAACRPAQQQRFRIGFAPGQPQRAQGASGRQRRVAPRR